MKMLPYVSSSYMMIIIAAYDIEQSLYLWKF